MDIEVSVIVPIYNVELYIEKCIKSILNQTFRQFELILINDGSCDNSLEICKKYKNDFRVRIITQPNKGLSEARNTGIRVARGKYLFFIDGDDYVNARLLDELYREIVLEKADIVQCGFIWVMENGELKEERYKGCVSKKVIYQDSWYNEYERNNLLFTCAWNKLYKKTLFNNIRYPKGKITEDEYVLFPLFCKVRKVVIVNQPFYYYVQRKSGLSGTAKMEQRVENYLDYSSKRLKLLKKKNKEFYEKYLYMHFQGLKYYEGLITESQLDYKLVQIMKRKSIRYILEVFRDPKIDFRNKIDILKWNIKFYD